MSVISHKYSLINTKEYCNIIDNCVSVYSKTNYRVLLITTILKTVRGVQYDIVNILSMFISLKRTNYNTTCHDCIKYEKNNTQKIGIPNM